MCVIVSASGISVATMGSQEESKFAHLLQPIRDLAANWDINIASDLEEYLVGHAASTLLAFNPKHNTNNSLLAQGVLEHITFSFDGGPTLNFAEGTLCNLHLQSRHKQSQRPLT